MRDHYIDLCGQIDFTRTEAMPLLARDAHFSFACNGCGDCCRGREDIVLSGFDLWRIAARLRLPPQIVARGYCRASIGTVSHLPVLRLAPVKENRNNCPFLTGDHCAIHDAEPLVCALYPLAQEISRKGQVSYFLQPTGCGGQVIEARVEDYLARYDVPAREQTDVRWAQTCMIVARGYCRASIGTVSHLPVLRLAPVKENRNNCPFLTGDHCAIHDAEPLVCALYPLAQEISRKGQVSYFLQPTGCGGQVIEARVEDYLARYDVPAREQTDVRWAQTCMTLEDTVEQLGAQLSPVLVRRMQDKLWQALYFGYDYAAPFLPQLEKNLHWLDAEFAKLTEYQQKRNNTSK